ncbi:hypothetical protein Pan44_13270 [Caulifigura coniformis]|uniref:Peptidase MA-like domain-containing protein n=1 Tax=Caulifigura coniformis TaxID=2527983 RepID=A0A517SAZ4_9PLAN|nr:hypothetical protein [Caulifigura coniformis]QDT53311.1 hypothetical protein Pan44_13270 [Caulifigura coniformis]
MDAWTACRSLAICVLFVSSAGSAFAAAEGFRTANFVVNAPTQEIAQKVGNCAEYWREELAVEWLGKKLPNWYKPCEVTVQVGQIGAGGATTFSFEGGEVFGWRMRVQGTLERILDSVVPHEVSHTIFACHFRRPLPRWADEGAATLVEHISERKRQMDILQQVTRTRDRIPLAQLLQIDEYPKDMQKVLALYAEGYSLADFLVKWHGDRGKQVYLEFLKDALATNWESAFRKHYGFQSLAELDQHWDRWVIAGSPEIRRDDAALALANQPAARPSPSGVIAVAAAEETPRARPGKEIMVRGQSEQPAPAPVDTPRPIATPRMARPLRTASASQNGVTTAAARPANAPPSDRFAEGSLAAPRFAQPPAREERLIPLDLEAPDPITR